MWLGWSLEAASAKEANEEIRRRHRTELGSVRVIAGSWVTVAVEVPLYQVEPSCQVQGWEVVYTQQTLAVPHFWQGIEAQSRKLANLLCSHVGSLR
jgi:hypothetical protein